MNSGHTGVQIFIDKVVFLWNTLQHRGKGLVTDADSYEGKNEKEKGGRWVGEGA